LKRCRIDPAGRIDHPYTQKNVGFMGDQILWIGTYTAFTFQLVESSPPSGKADEVHIETRSGEAT
jgi:hypothetical protein